MLPDPLPVGLALPDEDASTAVAVGAVVGTAVAASVGTAVAVGATGAAVGVAGAPQAVTSARTITMTKMYRILPPSSIF
jgi:3-oxoacyl-ACP reductase-like protein